jgi:hypothetical protein
MTTQYTTILKLALPVQGELSGTWGDVVNDNITQMVEQAVAGKAVINTWTANSHTLTTADGTTSESRCAILELTDSGTALTAAGTVVCPTNTKLYIVDNNTAEIITVQTAAGTGVAVPVGKTMLVYCDGTNVVEGVTHANSLSLGTSTNTVNAISIATDLGAGSSSDSNLPTQLAVKTYVDGQIAATNELSEVLAAGNVTGANDIDVENAQKVQFRDAAIYLNSSVDGQLDIVADTEIQIAATTVDLNGDLDVSGTALVTGVLTTTAATVFNGGFASNADSTLGTDKKVQFRDAAIYLNSSVDGQLDIVADGEVQIDTALVDINGNLDVSGTTNISGSVSFTKNAIAGVAISTTSRASNTVTVTTSAVHGLTSGDLVNVNGVADTSFNGYFTVSVSSTTVFTYSQTGADGSSTGGTSTEVVYNLNASGTALNWMNGPLNIAANSGIDGLEITQSGAGNGLHVTGTTGLVGNTTLTGNLDVSGTTLVTGVLTTTAATVFNGGFASNADSTLGTDKKVQFRDSAIYINSSVDGQLDLVADTEIQIAATTVDLNGNLDVSGTALVTGVLTTTAATVHTNGITMPDNAKAIFGAGSDLQIYHDGDNSYINDSGVGDLKLGGNQLQLNNAAQTRNYIYAVDEAQVELKYNNELKLATTATGIDVTGTAVANGFTLGNNAEYINVKNSSGAATRAFGVNAGNNLYIGGIDADIGPILFVDNGATLATLGPTGLDVTGTVTAGGAIGAGGVTPAVWSGTYRPIQAGEQAIAGVSGQSLQTYNARFDSAWKYINTNFANYIEVTGGSYIWNTAPSGSAGDTITFTPRMTLDASGNLLVGTTSPFGTTGTTINAAGLVYSSADGDRSGQFDRTGVSDGEIVRFTKAGATVGSIGTAAGPVAYIVLNDAATDNVAALKGASGAILPSTNAGADKDGTMNLGSSGARFESLYLSGGVVFGDAGGSGTPASNTLDSYEEGTCTITIGATTTNPTITEGNTLTANYTKVGGIVTVQAYTGARNFTDVGSGNPRFTGLPFSSKSGVYSAVTFVHNTFFSSSSAGYIESGSSYFTPIVDNGTSVAPFAGTGTRYLMFSVTYQAA